MTYTIETHHVNEFISIVVIDAGDEYSVCERQSYSDERPEYTEKARFRNINRARRWAKTTAKAMRADEAEAEAKSRSQQ